MIFRLLHRYILKEIITVFLAIIVVFTVVITTGNMLKLSDFIINKGVGIVSVLKLIFYIIPYLISFTIPMALVTAVLLVFGRLSHDNEITALKASGIGFFKITYPVVLFALFLSIFSFFINNGIVLRSHLEMRKLLVNIGYEKPIALLEAGRFINFFNNYIFYFKNIDDNKIDNIIIYELRKDKPIRTINAKSGLIKKDENTGKIVLFLYDGTAEEPDAKNPKKFFKMAFQSLPIVLEMDEEERYVSFKNKRLKEMNFDEIDQEIAKMEAKGVSTNRLKTEYHKKIVFPFASFFLVLPALALAVYSKRGEKSIGFGISLLLIFFYYLLTVLAKLLGEEGLVIPYIAMWLPNIVVFIVGVGMILKIRRL